MNTTVRYLVPLPLLALALTAPACDRRHAATDGTARTEEATRAEGRATPPPELRDNTARAEPVIPSPAEARGAAATGTTETTGAALGVQGDTTGDAKGKTAAPGTSLPPFEGKIDVDVQGKAPESLTYAMKGDKIRLGLSSTPGKNDKGVDAIVDTTARKAYVLLNDKKQFVEIDLQQLAAKAATRAQQIDVQRTGKTSEVGGRSCEEWVLKDKAAEVHACVAKGAPPFDLAAIEQKAGITAPAWVHTVVDEGYIPLRVSVTDPKGTPLASTHVADTSRKVDDSTFAIPPGYTKTDAAKLQQQVR